MLSTRKGFRQEIAKQFVYDIQNLKSRYYGFLGKNEEWNGTETPPTSIPLTQQVDATIRDQITYAKLISPSDVSVATRKIKWVSGTVYAQWDHTVDMTSLDYYVVNSESAVYKCLDNAKGGASTVQPTGNSLGVVRTSDGYLWKYMYSIPAFKRSRFSNSVFIPVQNSISNTFYSNGGIAGVAISNAGSGYIEDTNTVIQVSGMTTGAGAVLSLTVGDLGQILSVTIVNGGSAYTRGAKIKITSATGTGAVLVPTFNAGVLTSVYVSSAGVGYLTSDSVVAAVGGAQFKPKVSRETGSIENVNILDEGAGYTSPPILTVVGAGGTGKFDGNTSAIIDAIENDGSVVMVTISDPGVNYPTSTATQITVVGDGTGAVLTPVVVDGMIADVIVENMGSGYTYANLSVSGIGSGASLKALLSSSDFVSDQSIVELTAKSGAIYNAVVTAGGSNYTGATTATIVGDGTGATATPIIQAGVITGLTVTGFGKDYSYASVVFTDTLGSGASAYVILPPNGGHGSDAVSELNGTTVALAFLLKNETISSIITQEYRQYGLLKNPNDYFFGKPYTAPESLVLFKTTFASTGGLVKDEVLLLGLNRFRVVEISGTEVYLQPLFSRSVNPIGTLVAEIDSNRTYACQTIIESPGLNKYSGQLIITSYEPPFTFNSDQGVTLKTFIQF